MDLQGFGRVLVVIGAAIVLVGVVFIFGHWLGWRRLPGDIVIRGKKVTVYIPLTAMIIVSVVLTIVVNLWIRR